MVVTRVTNVKKNTVGLKYALFRNSGGNISFLWNISLRRELNIRRAASIFDELRGVTSSDEKLYRMLDISSQTK